MVSLSLSVLWVRIGPFVSSAAFGLTAHASHPKKAQVEGHENGAAK
jgi:hypothetical protein